MNVFLNNSVHGLTIASKNFRRSKQNKTNQKKWKGGGSPASGENKSARRWNRFRGKSELEERRKKAIIFSADHIFFFSRSHKEERELEKKQAFSSQRDLLALLFFLRLFSSFIFMRRRTKNKQKKNMKCRHASQLLRTQLIRRLPPEIPEPSIKFSVLEREMYGGIWGTAQKIFCPPYSLCWKSLKDFHSVVTPTVLCLLNNFSIWSTHQQFYGQLISKQ